MIKNINFALLNLTGDLYARGSRQLVGFLNQHGIKSEIFFLPGEKNLIGLGLKGTKRLTNEDLNVLLRFLKKYQVIGFSSMADYFIKTKDLGQKLKKTFPQKIFLLGGILGITQKDELIKENWIDGICFQEGELAMLEFLERLVKNYYYWKTPGFYFKKEGKIFKNKGKKLINNIDQIPPVDYSKGLIVLNGQCRKISPQDIKDFFGTTLWTATSRGCYFRCSYCINSFLSPEEKKVRFHSPEYVIKEIKLNLRKFNFLNCVYFNDESMSFRKKEELENFLKIYNQQIGLPWGAYFDPFTLNPNQIDFLVKNGLKKFKIGLQSGSKRINFYFFNRKTDYKKFRKILEKIKKYRGKISLPIIDIITDIPWANKKDLIKEISFLNSLPRPFTIEAFSLSLYPGCTIYNQAIKEKIISPSPLTIQNHVAGSKKIYGGVILPLASFLNIPPQILKLVNLNWQLPILAKLLNYAVKIRKLFYQIKAKDPTLLPYKIGRYLKNEKKKY
ncbi:MAG: B12-binding domain-containing radical SAM protein [Microgenomates group bacterium]